MVSVSLVTVFWMLLLTGTQANDCVPCDDVDEPICGRSEITGQIKTFKSECLMQADNCAGLEEHTLLNKGECLPEVPACLAFCTGIDKPICTVIDLSGEWGTYPSECLLDRSNCIRFPGARKIAEGPCPTDCPICDKHSELHKEVCGKYANGTTATFANYCTLLLDNCKAPDAKIAEVSDAECHVTTTLTP